jgi:hypothetical protein
MLHLKGGWVLLKLLPRGQGFKGLRVQLFGPAGVWAEVFVMHLNPRILDPLDP